MNNEYLKYDLPAAFVVFLVALPLCLGIALASGVPLFAGIISGVVGGIVAGALSGSNLSVSGPAAGLTTVILAAMTDLGTFPALLFCIVLAGVFQIALGYMRAGAIGHFFPSAVIKGMLAAIGLILILKQVPHALGYDADFEGDESFSQGDGLNTFTEIVQAADDLSAGAIIISILSVTILITWESGRVKENKFFRTVPAPLVVVLAGILLNILFTNLIPALAINPKHMVAVPSILYNPGNTRVFNFPDFTLWHDPRIYITAMTIATVASLETLLNIEASDKFDPFRRITPPNRELKAQGVANVISGLLGGLPVTSVIVRSSTNITAGARTKASAIMHGMILLLAILVIPHVLAMIPLACLAGLLMFVGFKLTRPEVYKEVWRKGAAQ